MKDDKLRRMCCNSGFQHKPLNGGSLVFHDGAGNSWASSSPLSESESTQQEEQRLETEDDTQSDHGSDNTGNGKRHAMLGAGSAGSGGGVAGAGGRAGAVSVATSLAPLLLRGNSELVRAVDKVGPGQESVVLAKERVHSGLGSSGDGAVVEQESHLDIGRRGHGFSRVGDQLPRHRGGVIGDAREVDGRSRQLGETEVGLESAIGAKLDVQL